jgi:hypothetical protein
MENNMDATDYSLDAMLRHCDQLVKSGKESLTNGKALKTACRSVINPLAPELRADVRKIDIESAISSFKGNNPTTSKDTISNYSGRLKNVLASFVEQAEKPLNIPSETEPVSAPERTNFTYRERLVCSSPKKPTSSYTLNVPLRPDFMAQLIIPYDIQRLEIKLILKMLEPLAMSKEELDS